MKNPIKYILDSKNDNLDERQIALRGKIFQHSFVVMMLLLFTNVCLSMIFELPQLDSYIIIAISLASIDIEMIYYEIYPISYQVQRRIFILCGITGIFLMILSANHIFIEGNPIFNNYTFSQFGVNFIVGFCFTLILGAYIIRLLVNRKNNIENE